jgi:putative nucleotidyltransferase with HDIG domain
MEELRKVLTQAVAALGNATEKRDPYTAGHQDRVTALARHLPNKLGLDADTREAIRLASLLHDVGKIGVPVEILSKPGKLDPSEYNLIRRHSTIGYEIVKDIEFPWPVARIVLEHHEYLDGSGYPDGKKDSEICFGARIVTVADVTDAMMSFRPYHSARSRDTTIDTLIDGRGIKFDGDVVDACVELLTVDGFEFAGA